MGSAVASVAYDGLTTGIMTGVNGTYSPTGTVAVCQALHDDPSLETGGMLAFDVLATGTGSVLGARTCAGYLAKAQTIHQFCQGGLPRVMAYNQPLTRTIVRGVIRRAADINIRPPSVSLVIRNHPEYNKHSHMLRPSHNPCCSRLAKHIFLCRLLPRLLLRLQHLHLHMSLHPPLQLALLLPRAHWCLFVFLAGG